MSSNQVNNNTENMTKDEKLMQGIAAWASYYQSRPDIFADEYLGISLKPFQKILIYCMMHYNYTAFFASRGLGKVLPYLVVTPMLESGKIGKRCDSQYRGKVQFKSCISP